MIPDPCVRVLFPQSLKIRTKKTYFLKILEIVCISELGTGKEKCISEMGTGKEIGSQIWGLEKKIYPKRNWFSKWGPEGFLPVPSFESKILFRSLLLGYIFFSGPYILE